MSETTTYLVDTEHKAEQIVAALGNDGIRADQGPSDDQWAVHVVVPSGQEDAVEGVVGRFDEGAVKLTREDT